jgi:hypothetical protein
VTVAKEQLRTLAAVMDHAPPLALSVPEAEVPLTEAGLNVTPLMANAVVLGRVNTKAQSIYD